MLKLSIDREKCSSLIKGFSGIGTRMLLFFSASFGYSTDFLKGKLFTFMPHNSSFISSHSERATCIHKQCSSILYKWWCYCYTMIQVGRYPRHLISLFFRLLYPWYWPSSCWNFVISCIQAVFYSVLGFIFSTRNKIAKPKSQ